MVSFGIMKKTYALVVLLASVLLCQGCIYDELKDCEANGELIINLTHLYNSEYKDKLEKEIDKIDIFIYDEDGKIVRRITEESKSFTNGHNVLIEGLEKGSYEVVALGNLYEDTPISYIEERSTAHLELLADAESTRDETNTDYYVYSTPTTLFHGSSSFVNIQNEKASACNVDFLKVTNDISVKINWKDWEGKYCVDDWHKNTTRVYLEGNNGEMDFSNKLLYKRLLTYCTAMMPKTMSNITEVAVWVRTMRLIAEGSTMRLVVKQVQEDGTEKTVYTQSLIELIKLTGHYGTQELIDRESEYQIDLTFRCTEHNTDQTWVATTIYVNGWLVKMIDTEI